MDLTARFCFWRKGLWRVWMSMLFENVVAIGGCGEDCVDLNKSNQVSNGHYPFYGASDGAAGAWFDYCCRHRSLMH
ncbi:hypothetical protein Hanom_Chr12g01131971 [Helianthus anomalus]